MDHRQQRKLTRRALMGAGATMVAAGGAAVALHGSGFGPRPRLDDQTLIRGNNAEPDTLDPALYSASYEDTIVGDLFVGLFTENAAARPVPGAAESYRVSDDGLTYTFRLRDHRWSDGVPVTAEDFVFALRRVVDPKTAAQYASFLYPIRNAERVNAGRAPLEALGVRAIDARTLEIACDVQVPYVEELLSRPCAYPVPRHVIARHGDGWTDPGVMVGNGPYRLKEWIPNEHVALEWNPSFYDAKNVKIRRVVIHPTQDYAAALTRFRTGELDIDVNVPSQDIGWVKRNLPGTMHIAPYALTEYVLFNVRAKPVNDVRVRTALSLAIDRDAIVDRVMGAGEQAAWSFVPPQMPNYPGTAELRFRGLSMEARRARARQLLAEAGYGPARPLAFDFNITTESTTRLIAVAVQSMWKQIGAEVRMVPSDEKDHYNVLLKQNFSVAWAAWVADYLDANNFLTLLSTASGILNNGAYSNPAFDALIARSDSIRNPKERGACLSQAEQIALDDAAVAPIDFGVTRTLLAPAIRGWVDNPVNIHRTRWLSLDRRRTIA
ncbi:MAG TPA: peptide ABC transporter substrate-binding protein [Rhizomicrobium sp.]|jgi:oligopeptide transport system substrate-binding protein|nr:peptide ABC transporter substrate-binding protein [Rhizomicrobium sp.]